MAEIEKKKLLEIINRIAGRKICIIGDLMVDEYWIGVVKRISPEAPVPVVDMKRRELRLGGAANVAFNIAALGGKPFLIGTVGRDKTGERLSQLLEAKGMSADGIIIDEDRPTTRKTRIVADNQHITRVDHEDPSPVADAISDQIMRILIQHINEFDAVIFQDYNKGILTENLIKQAIEVIKKAGKIIAVDPKRNNFFSYKYATVFKPNLKEAEEALGLPLTRKSDLEANGPILRQRLSCNSLLITRGSEGMSLFTDDIYHVPTHAKKVSEVSGAGDTVISTLTCALCAGADHREAAVLANIAAGYVVEEVGIVPISKKELISRVHGEDDVIS